MMEVDISEFRAKCAAWLDQLQKTKKPIRITRSGRPVAEIIPVSSVAPADWMGSMKDSMKILGDIVSPASEPDEWEVLREEV
jgi:prevent-host-death family protein